MPQTPDNGRMVTPSMPSGLQPYFEKGIQAYTQGSYAYAVDLLTFVVKRVPDATEARRYLRLAIQKQYSQHPPSFLARLLTELLIVPARLWAALCVAQGQSAQAVHLYERLLGVQPRSKSLLMSLALTLSRAGLDDAALAAYEEILGIAPNHVQALRKLARLSMKRGNDEQARQCFERILTLTPNDLEAQQGLRNLDALGTIKKGFTT